jgi:hypothetical protein
VMGRKHAVENHHHDWTKRNPGAYPSRTTEEGMPGPTT